MPLRSVLKKTLPAPVLSGVRAVRDASARTLQSAAESCGFIIARKSDYYSPLPSRKELLVTKARWAAPKALRGVPTTSTP